MCPYIILWCNLQLNYIENNESGPADSLPCVCKLHRVLPDTYPVWRFHGSRVILHRTVVLVGLVVILEHAAWALFV